MKKTSKLLDLTHKNVHLIILLLFVINISTFLLLNTATTITKTIYYIINILILFLFLNFSIVKMKKLAKLIVVIYIYFTLVSIIYIVILKITTIYTLINTIGFEQFLTQYSSFAIIILFTVSLLQPICLPIPEAVTVVAASVVLGPALSTVISFLGSILGIVVMFSLVRVGSNKIQSHKNIVMLQKYRKLVSKNETLYMVLMFIIPVLPDEIICLGAGLSAIKFRKFLIIAAISKLITSAFLSYSVLTAEKLSITNTQLIIIIISIILIIAIIKWFIDKSRLVRK